MLPPSFTAPGFALDPDPPDDENRTRSDEKRPQFSSVHGFFLAENPQFSSKHLRFSSYRSQFSSTRDSSRPANLFVSSCRPRFSSARPCADENHEISAEKNP